MNSGDNSTDTAKQSTAAPKAGKSSYGRASKNRRKERRAAMNNPAQADAITNQAKNRLGLQSTSDLIKLSPAYALRPTAVHVDLHACNMAVTAMIARMRSVAQRPLAILLADVGRVTSFRKICSYILFARVCAAQLNVSYAAGVPLELIDAISAEQLRIIDARCFKLPNFFAWMLSQIGSFEIDSQQVIPTMPHPAEPAVEFEDALRGNYFSICHYVNRHRPGVGGDDIPEDDMVRMPRLQAMYPLMIQDLRFAPNTVAYFDAVVTGIQWDEFAEINGALAEQECCVSNFVVSEAIGTEAARVRFTERLYDHEQVNFYACDPIDDVMIRNALIVRLGLDVDIPQNMEDSRFVMNRTQAPVSGNDVPAPYLQAQLQMITKLKAR